MSARYTHHVTVALSLLAFLVSGCADTVYEDRMDPIGMPEVPPSGPLKGDNAFEPEQACPESPSYYLEFLDDTRCRKALPTNRDRDLTCPTAASTTAVFSPGQDKVVEYHPATQAPEVDSTALVGLVPEHMRITVVLVRRVDGRPVYRYLSNGRHDETFEPWSSTKFMAVANAGAHLREQSNGHVGLTAEVDGLLLGDLVSIVHTYKEVDFTSNGLARWFLNVGDRSRLNGLIHADWLGRPEDESLGGNYGAPTPAIGYELNDESGSVTMQGLDQSGPTNRLSTLSITEFLKRLVMHREDPDFALPFLQWADVRTLLYGAEDSRVFDASGPQGMEGDTSIYLQAGLDMEAIDRKAQGQWRIFSKLGFGGSRGGEFVNAGYACLPALHEEGTIKIDEGKEFFIVSQMGAQWRHEHADAQLADVYGRLVNGIMSGTIK